MTTHEALSSESLLIGNDLIDQRGSMQCNPYFPIYAEPNDEIPVLPRRHHEPACCD